MDRLLMSLDDIMAAKNKEFKEKAAQKKAANKTKVGNMKTNLNKNNTNQRSTPYLETNPSRSVVIPIIKKVPINNYVDDRPVVKIIQPQPQQVIVTKTVVKKPIEQKTAATTTTSVSVFARLGKQPVSGTRVTFDNLHKSVTISDLKELSAVIGEVKDIEFSQSASNVGGGKGKKVAVVLFARRSDALSCIEKYNGLTLDNSLLEVSLTEENGSSSSITQVAAAPKTVFERLQGKKIAHNVKAGLFGTAIENDEDDDEDGQEEYEQQQVVTYAHQGGEQYMQQDEDDDGNDGQVQFAVTMNKHQQQQYSSSNKVVQPYRQVVYHDNRNNNNNNGNHNGSNQPYRGNNRPNNNYQNNSNKRSFNNNNNSNSNNNNSVKRSAKQVVSSVDLDNELDSYFAAK